MHTVSNQVDFNYHVKLVLDNEQDRQERALELARQAQQDEYPRATLRDSLKDYVEEMVYGIDGTAGDLDDMARELIGCAMSAVDWYALAESYLSDVAELDA